MAPFHGVAASLESGVKTDELEVITGGRYSVRSLKDEDDQVHAVLVERDVLRLTPDR